MKLHVQSRSQLIDEPVSITGSGFEPDLEVTLSMQCDDIQGCPWLSEAVYRANHQGNINVSLQAPLSGSYQGCDPLGLIWSMKPAENNQSSSIFIPPKEGSVTLRLTAKQQNKTQAVAVNTRYFASNQVTVHDINTAEVKGCLYLPPGEGPFPAVLVCAGSEGGIRSQLATASLLAAHGYAVFVFAYYNHADLPKKCYEIPLERFAKAVQWLSSQPKIDAKRLAALAPSKGAEGWLAACAYLSEIQLRAVVAISPSSVVWQGFGGGKPEPRSSWTLNNTPLTYAPMDGKKMLAQLMRGKVAASLSLKKNLAKAQRVNFLPAYNIVKAHKHQACQIPVEKIRAPLMLIAGDDDAMWPSAAMVSHIQTRREKNAYAKQDEIKIFAGAGHLFRLPHLPTSISWLAHSGSQMIVNFGGEPKINAYANQQAWQQLLAFLSKHLC